MTALTRFSDTSKTRLSIDCKVDSKSELAARRGTRDADSTCAHPASDGYLQGGRLLQHRPDALLLQQYLPGYPQQPEMA